MKCQDQSALAVLFVGLASNIICLDFYVGVVTLGVFPLDEPLFYRFPDSAEDLSDVVVVLGTALHEWYPVFASQRVPLCEADLSLCLFAVDFVAHDDLAHALRLGLVDLFDPVFKVIEGLSIGDGVDEDHPGCALVVSLGDGFEAFLSGGIPDLHFDFDAVDVNGFDFEVDSDGGDVGHLVLLVDVAEQDVSLPHCSVPDNDQLDQVIVLLFVSSLGHL